MWLCLIVVGLCMFCWVEEGWQEYVKCLLVELFFELVEILFNICGKNVDVVCLICQEGEVMLVCVQLGEWVVILEVEGWFWSIE